uniref:NADH dehydrogenase subunit 2 n=1 Tax=Inocellia fulvostigmata TaxID=3018577 RepID=UPI0022FD4D2B|nr:NADH dehydrogenase subunit 2 [Inocellia fulvostigmata]WBK02758.1 NADH dehydrogenase subunit 2 [Inocellia fulvostigmata]
MFFIPNKFLFFSMLMGSTIFTISSNSWLGAWMGLEINLLSFIPLMSNTKNIFSTEASLKYFLTQAFASSTLVFFIIFSFLIYLNYFSLNMNNSMKMLILSSLFLKLGAAPFHFWFPSVAENLTWMMNLILLTWQKIAPMILISYLNNEIYLQFIAIFSTLVGSLGGLNQTNLRKIMAFSSINHIGWMISSLIINNNLWKTYFMIYSLLTILMISIFMNFNLYFINQIYLTMNFNLMNKFLLFMNFLSLGGLPPFLGFFPKWMIVNNLIFNNYFFLLTVMSVLTLINLYFYLRLALNSFLLLNMEQKWFIKINFKMNYFMISMSMISLLSLPLFTLLYFIF